MAHGGLFLAGSNGGMEVIPPSQMAIHAGSQTICTLPYTQMGI